MSLLPPNATPLERALADTAPRALLDTLADAPARLQSELPDALTPWLAAEWFLADFARYFPDAHALIAAGLPWLKVRGTAAAVKQALAWIDLTATLEPDDARLQLDPGTAFASDNLADIRHLVDASIPAHVQLYRLYHIYDLRHVICDRSQLDDAVLDDDSGIWRDGVKLSFGTRTARLVDPESPVIPMGMLPAASTSISDDNSWRLDAWPLDTDILLDSVGGQIGTIGATLDLEPDADIWLWVETFMARVMTDVADPDIADRLDRCAAAMPSEVRGWAGAWSGHWREPIPSRLTQEVT